MHYTDPSTINWQALDWNKTNAQLARETGVHPHYARRARQYMGKPNPNKHKHTNGQIEKNLAEWMRWDWSRQDAELAEAHSLSRERVRQIRKRLSLPLHPNSRKRRNRIYA